MNREPLPTRLHESRRLDVNTNARIVTHRAPEFAALSLGRADFQQTLDRDGRGRVMLVVGPLFISPPILSSLYDLDDGVLLRT